MDRNSESMALSSTPASKGRTVRPGWCCRTHSAPRSRCGSRRSRRSAVNSASCAMTREHGQSAVPPGPYTIDQLVCDVIGLLTRWGSRCSLSCCRWVARQASGRSTRSRAHRPAGALQYHTVLGPPAAMDARIATIRREGMGALVEGILNAGLPQTRSTPCCDCRADQEDAAANPSGRLHRLLRGPAGHGSACGPGRIAAPTLVIAGTFDPAPTPAAAREWASMIRMLGSSSYRRRTCRTSARRRSSRSKCHLPAR